MKSSADLGSERRIDAGARVEAVRARRLGRGSGSPAIPAWARCALRPPTRSWPEHADEYLVEVVCADGAIGRYGPCSATTVRVIADQLAPLVLGMDVSAFRLLRGAMVGRHRSGAHVRVAVSAVELAVLDAAARRCGVSVARLLGGPTRERVPGYASALGLDVDHPIAADVAAWLAEQGYWGQKWFLPGFIRGEEPRRDAARLEGLRAAAGADARVMVDAGGTWSDDYALRMIPALHATQVAWLEEPFDHRVAADWARLRSSSPVPLAAGEHAYDRTAQLYLLIDRVVDVWQPDVGWAGGIEEALWSVELAATLGLRTFPHGGSLAGALALAGLTAPADVPAVEYHLTQAPRRESVMAQPMEPRGGWLPVPQRPGLAEGYLLPDGAPATLLAGRTDAVG